MRFRILLIALISTTVALAQQEKPRRPARTSQAQIKYNDPNGSKVDWKFFAPQNQWRAHLEASQRTQRGQTEYVHPQQSVQRAHQSELVQLQQELDPSQYKVQYQQAQATQADPSRYKGHPQSQLTQPGSHQYKGYPQVQAQPQAQLEQPVHVEYRPYPQPQVPVDAQPAPLQVQYKAYSQAQTPQHPVDAQPAPVQVQYSQPQSRVDTQSHRIHYKAYQQAQAQAQAEPQPEQNQVQQKAYAQAQAHQEPVQQYRPLSEGPAYLKQLLLESFKPQRPYADPSAFLYTTNFAVPQPRDQQPANAELSHYEQPSESYEQPEQLKTRREYTDSGLQGKIVYKDDYKQQEQQQSPQVQYVQVPIEKIPNPSPPRLVFDKSMPPEIRQLLQYQAQLPYDVTANSITYKPKTLFIPKPLPSDASGPYQYRSKVYYVNDDRYDQVPEFETAKPVQEEQRH
ncbi:uncharacterized protein LOC143360840 [Halictus rubicundus]|uniref:uncharacterized protein LOC143360840 n=1 Tax=Halictus rubicundus TaxID=77578 RepID=UPI0040367B6F